jgi:hypothetical protein
MTLQIREEEWNHFNMMIPSIQLKQEKMNMSKGIIRECITELIQFGKNFNIYKR